MRRLLLWFLWMALGEVFLLTGLTQETLGPLLMAGFIFGGGVGYIVGRLDR